MTLLSFTSSLFFSILAISIARTFDRNANNFLEDERRSGSSMSIALEKRVGVEVEMGKAGVKHKMAYFGTIKVGSPAQKFSVVYDTGSGNLIIPGSGCEDAACRNHDRFNGAKSSTVKPLNCDGSPVRHGKSSDKLTITFGTGHITGKCVQDEICIGDLCATGSFVSSTSESSHPFAAFSFDGVLGLALDKMAHAPDFSIMSRMVNKELLAEPIFSVFLSDSDKETSEITFGEIKREHMASHLFWVPVTRASGYWEVQIQDITLNNKQQQICQDCHVAVDTGTSQLGGPSDIITQLEDRLNVKEDCSNFKKLPKLGFMIGDHILNLSPRDYVDRADGACHVSLMKLDVPPPKGPLFIFGIPFLQKFFSVYDHAKTRVGFAIAKHDGHEEVLVTIDRHVQKLNTSAAAEHPSSSREALPRRLRRHSGQ